MLLVAALAGVLTGASACKPGGNRESLAAIPEIKLTTVRGHVEGRIEPDQTITPVFYDTKRPFGICFRIPTGTDTSTWAAALELDGCPRGEHPSPNTQRIQIGPDNVCFQRSFDQESVRFGEHSLCITVREGKQVFVRDARRPLELRDPVKARASSRAAGSAPFFETGLKLVAIQSSLEGAATLEQIEDRLNDLPPWLDRPEASDLAAQKSLLAAVAQVDLGGSLQRAQERLHRAQEAFETVASRNWVSARLLEADLLSRVGAAEQATEGLERTRTSCKEDRAVECEEKLLPSLDGGLAWLLLLWQDPSPAQTRNAEKLLQEAIAADEKQSLEERANRRVNLGYLKVLQEGDPSPPLTQARGLLESAGEGERKKQLLAWADLVEGEGALKTGDARRALDLCHGLGARHTLRDRLLLAWAASCSGQAHLLRDEPEKALASYESALLLHEHARPMSLGSTIPMGADRLADDFYHAAWIAATRLDDPERGLRILDRLDFQVVEMERRCIDTLSPPERLRVGRLQAERDRLLERNRQLEEEDPEGVDATTLQSRKSLREEIRELTRKISAPCPLVRRDGPVEVDVRAVPLPEGMLLFEKDPQGRIRADFREYPRHELKAQIEDIDRHLETSAWTEEQWRSRLQPLARLLLPTDVRRRHGPQISFALYGILQGVPVAALPVSSGELLADLTTVVLRPAAVPAAGGVAPGPLSKALFLVNPTLNLKTDDTANFYLHHFPQALVLSGKQARKAVLKNALNGVEILHFDGHADLDPAFPELSELNLADGDLSLSQIHELYVPSGLVNLSGCETGKWPVTADSGRYGLAGRFARLGTPWVIGSRGQLDNRLANRFNRAFYLQLSGGSGVVESYRSALRQVRDEHRGPHPMAWSGLLLLGGGGEPGQSSALRTPS